MHNPFSLVFGQPPLEFIERTAQAERIISEFTREMPANSVNLVTGIRGSGKTVFITQIAERLGSQDEWVIINLNPQRDMLTALAAKLNSDRYLNRIFREAEINLQAFGIGIGIKGVPPIDDIEEALVRMLKKIGDQKKRVLITVDEASNSKEMRIFASAYQIFLREHLPVYLIMTGLYKNIDALRNAEGMTFLERAPRTVLTALNLDAAAEKYKNILSIRQDEAIRLSHLTEGYAFAFQVIGYFFWENKDDREKAVKDARDYLYEFAYWKIWSELSKKDRSVLVGMAKVPTGEVFRIREVHSMTSNQFNPYRERLIRAGVVDSPDTGILRFSLPFFGEFAAYASSLNNEVF